MMASTRGLAHLIFIDIASFSLCEVYVKITSNIDTRVVDFMDTQLDFIDQFHSTKSH